MPPFFVKAVLLTLLLWQVALPPKASRGYFRYERTVRLPESADGQACAVLGGEVFSHAAASLKDLRLYRGDAEVPYATTLSETTQQESEEARILNLGTRAGMTVFDLEMPHRPYTEVTLDLAAKDFIATAVVTGEVSAVPGKATGLGSFTLFDLTTQHLSHSTSLPLQESSFPFLHVELTIVAAPGTSVNSAALRDPAIVRSATVPPSREAQTVYTVVASTAILTRRGRQSVASFEVPVRVPIERVSVVVAPEFKGNFSRDVVIKAHAVAGVKQDAVEDADAAVESDGPQGDETLAGTISRVHTIEAGHELTGESLSVPAAIGSNMQRPASLEVAINNGDDQPLPITAVRLEMRRREICFDAGAGAPLQLFYGDAALDAPVYDYAKLFRPVATPVAATLGDETPNANFQPRTDAKPFTERHPELLWVGLLIVVGILAVTAIRSAKKLR